jgi:hypothetical protein
MGGGLFQPAADFGRLGAHGGFQRGGAFARKLGRQRADAGGAFGFDRLHRSGQRLGQRRERVAQIALGMGGQRLRLAIHLGQLGAQRGQRVGMAFHAGGQAVVQRGEVCAGVAQRLLGPFHLFRQRLALRARGFHRGKQGGDAPGMGGQSAFLRGQGGGQRLARVAQQVGGGGAHARQRGVAGGKPGLQRAQAAFQRGGGGDVSASASAAMRVSASVRRWVVASVAVARPCAWAMAAAWRSLTSPSSRAISSLRLARLAFHCASEALSPSRSARAITAPSSRSAEGARAAR